jgi:Flp pilus assembly protein TadD
MTRRSTPGTRSVRAGKGERGGVRSLWRAELTRGLMLARNDDAEGARAAFARAHALAPDEAQPAYSLARAEQRRGRDLEAERLLRVALAARPDWPLAAIALARLLAERAQPNLPAALTEARRVLAPAQARHPRHPLLQLVEAQLLIDEERVDESRALLERIGAGGHASPTLQRRCREQLARVENLTGIGLSRDGHDDAALFAFKRACDLDPGWAAPRANLGALWQRLNKPHKAREQYERALAIDAAHPLAHFNLGLLLRERGDLDGAAQAFAAAVTADPPHPEARVQLAMTLSDRGEHRRAILLFEEELRHGRSNAATIYTHLGVACAHAGEPTRAEAALRQALALDGNHAPALRNLAALYAAAGRWIDAAALLRHYKELGNSDRPPASK